MPALRCVGKTKVGKTKRSRSMITICTSKSVFRLAC
jgi:hypothetical protein